MIPASDPDFVMGVYLNSVPFQRKKNYQMRYTTIDVIFGEYKKFQHIQPLFKVQVRLTLMQILYFNIHVSGTLKRVTYIQGDYRNVVRKL